MPDVYDYPVWATQGGGLVRHESGNRYIFVKKPDCQGLKVGDEMPEEWGVIPANDHARQDMAAHDWLDPMDWDDEEDF